jgi:hypothetical protein
MIKMTDPITVTLLFLLMCVAVPLMIIVLYLMGGICFVFSRIIRTIKKTIKNATKPRLPKV